MKTGYLQLIVFYTGVPQILNKNIENYLLIR